MEPIKLVTLARRILPHAYAPYSGYNVAAALLTPEGDIFTGVNVENASLGLSICAERAAVAAAVAAGHRQFSRLALVADGEIPPFPCGACRQVLYEFAPGLTIYIAVPGKDIQSFNLSELLPHSFSPRGKNRNFGVGE